MKASARLLDGLKNIAILLLSASAIFLLLRITLQDGQTDILEPGPKGPVSHGSAAEPVFLLITGEDGSHSAMKYDNEGKQRLFAQFSAYLGEALGSAKTLTELSTNDFQTALSGVGVFFDYLYPQPLESIAAWLGTEATGELAGKFARRLFLGGEAGELLLCFIDSESSKIYRSKTALDFSSLRDRAAQFTLGGANFAFELKEEFGGLDPYFIFSHESTQLRAVTGMNPLREEGANDKLLDLFGMNPATVRRYPDSEHSAVYVDPQKSLRIGETGRLVFSAEEGSLTIPGGEGSPSLSEILAYCHGLVQNSLAQYSGSGLPLLAGVGRAGSVVTVRFLYYIDGVPVTLPNGEYAASFQISEGSILQAELYFRRYSIEGGSLSAMPEKQAATLANLEGGEPVLIYEDTLDAIGCGWIHWEHSPE